MDSKMYRPCNLLFVILLQAAVSCNDHPPATAGASGSKLSLELHAEKKQFHIGERIPVDVALVNRSADSVLINNRFLIGYEERDDRQIYFRIYTDKGKRYDLPEDHQADILPMPPKQSDMQWLAPGENVKNGIELTLTYPMNEPGKYKVVGVYESKPFEDTSGVYQRPVCSDTLEIEVIR